MAYLTYYSMQLPKGKDWTVEMKEKLISLDTGYFHNIRDVDDLIYNDTYDIWSWYDHEEDMSKLSESFPNELFALYGRGEDNEEWIKYFKDGKSQTVYGVVSFDPYDESKLK